MTDYKELAARLRERTFSKWSSDVQAVEDFEDELASEAASAIEALEAERDEARLLVTEANNSLYGSQGYFHSLDGGPFNRYHLADGIEKLKQTSNKHWHALQDAEARCKRLEAQVEQAFRDGLAYATNVVVTDADEAWRTSRARLAQETKP